LWEEAAEPGGKPHRHMENRDRPQPEPFCDKNYKDFCFTGIKINDIYRYTVEELAVGQTGTYLWVSSA